MKKILFFAASALFTLMIISCGSSKSTASQENSVYGTKLEQNECYKLAEAMPQKRVVGTGQSFSESTARQQAELDARAQLSRKIDAAILSASRNFNLDYAKSIGNSGEAKHDLNTEGKRAVLQQEISQNIISRTSVIKTERYATKSRMFTVFVCVEYDGTSEELAKKSVEIVKHVVSDADRAKIDAQQDAFMKETERLLGTK